MTKTKKYMLNMLKQMSLLAVVLLLVIQFPYYSVSAQTDINIDTQIQFKSGSLELTAVPSFDFFADISGQKYDAQVIPGTVDGFFMVEDGRGNEHGWNISVSLEEFTTVYDTPKVPVLKGAGLNLGAPTIIPYEAVGKPVTGYPAVLIAGDGIFHKVISAPPGTGGGAWKGTFSDVSLSVQARTAKFGIQNATLKWNIEDTP